MLSTPIKIIAMEPGSRLLSCLEGSTISAEALVHSSESKPRIRRGQLVLKLSLTPLSKK